MTRIIIASAFLAIYLLTGNLTALTGATVFSILALIDPFDKEGKENDSQN